MVGTSPENVVGVVLGLMEEGSHVVVVEPVLDLMTVTADSLYQPPILEQAQLM